MKRLIVTFILLILSSLAAGAQTAPDDAVLTKMLNDFLAGASKNDPAAHDKFWADDLIYTRSSGIRTTKAEIMKGLSSAPAPKPDEPLSSFSAEDVQIHQYGSTAIVAFRLVTTTTNRDGSRKIGNNLNTGVFLKRGGKWQVVAWQSTMVPESKVVPESKAEAKPAAPAGQTPGEKTPARPNAAHTFLKGARGGCYYLNAAGSKVYVDHKYCQ